MFKTILEIEDVDTAQLIDSAFKAINEAPLSLFGGLKLPPFFNGAMLKALPKDNFIKIFEQAFNSDPDKMLPEELASHACVHTEGLRGWQVAVRLHIPATDNVQASCRNMLLHPLECLRVQFANRLIHPGFPTRHMRFRKVIQHVTSSSRRCNRLVYPCTTPPTPYGV